MTKRMMNKTERLARKMAEARGYDTDQQNRIVCTGQLEVAHTPMGTVNFMDGQYTRRLWECWWVEASAIVEDGKS